MPTDIFVSYSRVDNENKKLTKFIEQVKSTLSRTRGRKQLDIFMDFKSIEPGTAFEGETIQRAKESHILLAFLSPSFFRSGWCLKEWKIFIERYKNSQKSVSIIPIIWELLEEEREFEEKWVLRDELTAEERQFFDETMKIQFTDWANMKIDPDQSDEEMRRLVKRIHNDLTRLSKRKENVSNTQIISKSIDNVSGKDWTEILDKIRQTPRANSQVKPVCLIYTGGTVGMVHEDEFDRSSIPIIGSVEDLEKNLPRLKSFKFDIHFFSYESPLDSSNMGSHDWLNLGKIIKELDERYQGFVVLHGANTLAYTASALSFMFDDLNKPIILTGAEIPLVELNSDAAQNVSWAIQCAAHQTNLSPGYIPEVCIMYGKFLLRGNRATKMFALNTIEGFGSPNFSPLGEVENNKISLNHRDIRSVSFDGERVSNMQLNSQILEKGVVILQTYPDMDMDFVRPILQNPDLKGLIIQSYGTGSAPDMLKGFLEEVERLLAQGVIIVNITQCPFGKVELQLHETSARFYDLGVIHGGDMTTEAAYCKLKYLMGYYRYEKKKGKDQANLEVIKREFQRNLRGELTFSAYSIKYPHIGDPYIVDPVFMGGAISIGHFDFEPSNIDHAFLRLQGIKRIGKKDGTLEISVFYDNQNINLDAEEQDFHHLLGEFRRQFTGEAIDHNIEVTSQIRRLLKRNKIHGTMQVLSLTGEQISFESMELVVYTKN